MIINEVSKSYAEEQIKDLKAEIEEYRENIKACEERILRLLKMLEDYERFLGK